MTFNELNFEGNLTNFDEVYFLIIILEKNWINILLFFIEYNDNSSLLCDMQNDERHYTK